MPHFLMFKPNLGSFEGSSDSSTVKVDKEVPHSRHLFMAALFILPETRGCILSPWPARGTLEINREGRIHRSKVGEYPLGDWYDGIVTLNGNSLTIGGGVVENIQVQNRKTK
jgi:hypothetical protein